MDIKKLFHRHNKKSGDTQTYINGVYYHLNVTKQSATVIGGEQIELIGALVIPEEVTVGEVQYAVTSIAPQAFKDYKEITSVVIGNNVTEIGESAFYSCIGMDSLTIGSSVATIGPWSFRGCSNLKSIQLPNSVTCIKRHAFGGCMCLTSIVIPDSVVCIERYAFASCNALTSVSIAESVTKLEEWVFAECTSLTSITIPNTVTNIGEYAFSGDNIEEMHVSWPTPIDINNNIINRGYIDILYVPAGTEDLYRATDGWKQANNILEEGTPKPQKPVKKEEKPQIKNKKDEEDFQIILPVSTVYMNEEINS